MNMKKETKNRERVLDTGGIPAFMPSKRGGGGCFAGNTDETTRNRRRKQHN